MGKTVIKLVDVYKIYQMGNVQVNALNGLNLEVKEHEFIAVMGPSGSGKSTAVNLIGCLDIPTKGTVYLDGKDISKLSESDLAKIRGQKIGFIFQQFNLMNTLTALENVMLPMMFQETSEEQRVSRAKMLLELVGLKDRMGHKPKELSGGQQQRVAIARALANDPAVVLADEPTGNLDSKSGEQIILLLQELHEKKGKTIIMVTHDEHLANRADKIACLMDGRITGTKTCKITINKEKKVV
jgi:putative ABC transport system ATP-binding protein